MWKETLLICCIALWIGQDVILGAPDDVCLMCICQTEGCERNIGSCSLDNEGAWRCGPFNIGENYWSDCGRLMGDYRRCTMELPCSVDCVLNFMSRYNLTCGGRKTCEDYAKLHHHGPDKCDNAGSPYWAEVERCLYG